MNRRAKELADGFDRSFAEPARVDRGRGDIALNIFVGGTLYLLKLEDVTLVTRAPKIVPLPNGSALQLGIAGIRGNLFTVFSLTALLGEPVQSHDWITVVRGIAFAFDGVDGQQELVGAPPNLLDVDSLLARLRA